MARNKKQKLPDYKAGDTVYFTGNGQKLTIKGEPRWNGFTYMYSFNEISTQCSENNISAINMAD